VGPNDEAVNSWGSQKDQRNSKKDKERQRKLKKDKESQSGQWRSTEDDRD
jgi:hypothetical protein